MDETFLAAQLRGVLERVRSASAEMEDALQHLLSEVERMGHMARRGTVVRRSGELGRALQEVEAELSRLSVPLRREG